MERSNNPGLVDHHRFRCVVDTPKLSFSAHAVMVDAMHMLRAPMSVSDAVVTASETKHLHRIIAFANTGSLNLLMQSSKHSFGIKRQEGTREKIPSGPSKLRDGPFNLLFCFCNICSLASSLTCMASHQQSYIVPQ